jgi:TfoX/Sxy family transcriptional regulator of competence genes
MAYNEALAIRIRAALVRKRQIEEKKMFGGLGILLRGNLLVGVWKDSLIVRLGPDQAPVALKEPHVRRFDITGKPMRGWVMVQPDGLEDDDQLADWIQQAIDFVGKLPAKEVRRRLK